MKNFKNSIFAVLLIFSGITFAQELHDDSNAASIANEANATTGWTGSSTITADTSDPYDGTYALKIVSTSNNTLNRRVSYSFTVVNGETYNISIWAKPGSQSNDPAFALWSGFSGFSTTQINNSAWTEYTFSLTANASSATIIAFTGSSSGSTGDELYIDRVSITQQSTSDTQNPTAPTLSSTGHTDTTVDLSWSGATDNVGVTGYDVYRDGSLIANDITTTTYQATGLTASTSYDFKVRAIDAAANESVDSNIISVTTNAASGGGTSVWTESGATASYSGDVAIGTSTVPTGYKMAVEGKIRTREVRVDQDTWPDYVFQKDYDLPTLQEVKRYIDEHGHLPNIPSAEEVEANGIELGEMNKLLLEKIEELTLHVIRQNNELTDQRKIIEELSSKIHSMETTVKK